MKHLREFNSINEALFLKKDFNEILDLMSSPIAKHLIKLQEHEKNFAFNLLNSAEKNDMISFSNFSNIKFKIKSSSCIYSSPTYYVADAAHFSQSLIKKGSPSDILRTEVKSGSIGTIKKIYSIDELNDFGIRHNVPFSHFIADDGKEAILIGTPTTSNDIEAVVSRKPTNGRIGRVIRRLLNESGFEFKDTDIEAFVNEYKSKFDMKSNITSLFELVKGERIKHFYLENNYEMISTSTLQTSCMRHPKCQEYLNIYSENEKQVSLLVLKSIANPEKITARAIVWKLDDGDTFMDRVYYSKDHEKDIFINYAIENGWYFKANQDSRAQGDYRKEIGGTDKKHRVLVTLENGEHDYYPYTDTLKYLNTDTGAICNLAVVNHNGFLESISGELNEECEYCNGTEEEECYECEGSGTIECDECYNGQNQCYDCDGNGEVECSSCDGEGDIECHECDGDGDIECDECAGDGNIDCVDCDGSGTFEGIDGDEECEACDGSGETKCVQCPTSTKDPDKGSGRMSCEDCSSRGRIDCDDCSSRGKTECYECDGEGSTDCDECGGGGDHDCWDCDGSGTRDCSECC